MKIKQIGSYFRVLPNLSKLTFIAFIIIVVSLVSLAVVITIPSRWKIQKDLNNVKASLRETTKDIKILCSNQCSLPYPESLEKVLLVSGGTLSEKEKVTCNQNCNNLKETQRSWGLEFIYRKYPYMIENKYYYYSSMINCLIGLGGCPPAFLREELGL